MLDSAGKRVAEQGQLQFLAERRERLDIHLPKQIFCTRVQLMYNICSKILRNSFLLGKEKSQHVSGPVSANIYVSFATKFICIICLTYITALHRCIFSLLIILCLLMCKSAGYVRLTAQQQQQLMRQKSLSASSNSVQSPPGL